MIFLRCGGGSIKQGWVSKNMGAHLSRVFYCFSMVLPRTMVILLGKSSGFTKENGGFTWKGVALQRNIIVSAREKRFSCVFAWSFESYNGGGDEVRAWSSKVRLLSFFFFFLKLY